MSYIFNTIKSNLTSGSGISVSRLPTFYPSSASCIDEVDNETVIGSCLRQQWYRCLGYPESNPAGLYSQYIFQAGHMWEDFLIEQFKHAGIWLGNNIKFAIVDRYISGEIDILIKDTDYDPLTGTGKAIVESKTYSSANYQAKKQICGSRDTKPEPKPGNVLQAFIYQSEFRDQVNKTYLTYLDRACGGPECNKEFEITCATDNDRTKPLIKTTDFYGNDYSYVDKRISIEGIFERYDSLMEHLRDRRIPTADFQHVYSDEQVESKYASGNIAKTKYENWSRNKDRYPIGDWECSYCGYKDLCEAQKKKDGHL